MLPCHAQVGVKDLVIKGRLRTTFIPLLYAMPIVGAVQVSMPLQLMLLLQRHSSLACCWIQSRIWMPINSVQLPMLCTTISSDGEQPCHELLICQYMLKVPLGCQAATLCVPDTNAVDLVCARCIA